jgi:hypothetical protein
MRILLLSVLCFGFLFSNGQNSNEKRKPCEFPAYINDKEIYTVVENQPSFPGGVNKLNKFIKSNFQNPNNIADSSITRISVNFIVDENGQCVNPCIITKASVNISAELESAVLDLFNAMPDWIPGNHRGENENVHAFFVIELEE